MMTPAESGDSSWLSTLLTDKHGFTVYQCAFRCALCFWYMADAIHTYHPIQVLMASSSQLIVLLAAQ